MTRHPLTESEARKLQAIREAFNLALACDEADEIDEKGEKCEPSPSP